MADRLVEQIRSELEVIEAAVAQVRRSLASIEALKGRQVHGEENAAQPRPADSLVQDLLAWAEEAPEETFEGVPTDGSVRLDDYLYGGGRH